MAGIARARRRACSQRRGGFVARRTLRPARQHSRRRSRLRCRFQPARHIRAVAEAAILDADRLRRRPAHRRPHRAHPLGRQHARARNRRAGADQGREPHPRRVPPARSRGEHRCSTRQLARSRHRGGVLRSGLCRFHPPRGAGDRQAPRRFLYRAHLQWHPALDAAPAERWADDASLQSPPDDRQGAGPRLGPMAPVELAEQLEHACIR